MAEIVTLCKNDVVAISDLLTGAFEHDVGFSFAFRTPSSKGRWLRKAMVASSELAIAYGTALGIRTADADGLAAVVCWFLPDRAFPPPWYRTVIPSRRLILMLLEVGTYLRYWQLYQTYLSMLPRNQRYFYLSALAVQPHLRNQGLGRTLIERGLALAAEKNCAVFLQCWSPMLPYYERLGFSTVSHQKLADTNDICHGLIWRP
jgi:GNAT superfamily N-acetyltransferase